MIESTWGEKLMKQKSFMDGVRARDCALIRKSKSTRKIFETSVRKKVKGDPSIRGKLPPPRFG